MTHYGRNLNAVFISYFKWNICFFFMWFFLMISMELNHLFSLLLNSKPNSYFIGFHTFALELLPPSHSIPYLDKLQLWIEFPFFLVFKSEEYLFGLRFYLLNKVLSNKILCQNESWKQKLCIRDTKPTWKTIC